MGLLTFQAVSWALSKSSSQQISIAMVFISFKKNRKSCRSQQKAAQAPHGLAGIFG
jgi:hypothetical protein